jgi:hypothetical protein
MGIAERDAKTKTEVTINLAGSETDNRRTHTDDVTGTFTECANMLMQPSNASAM